jgi:ketosteroid isomerase-like protein
MNKGLEQWHEIMHSGDTKALFDLIHPDCVFWSPVVHTPQVGRDITFAYLSAATHVLSEGFEYTREVVSEDHAVLEFTTTVNGIFVNGVDIITFSDDKILEFKVMVRPLKAVNAVHRRMGEMLEKLKAVSATH